MNNRATCAILATFALAACGGGGSSSSPTTSSTPTPAPSGAPVALSGPFSGPFDDNAGGVGTATLTLSESGNTLTGSFSDIFTYDTALNSSGTVSGTVNGSSISLTYTPGVAGYCSYILTGSATSSAISGSYTTTNCSTPDGGTFSFTQNGNVPN